jgi:lipopolysaccharide transport system ATP-binding protein
MDHPVELQELWKSYRKGSGAYRYQTLREVIYARAARIVGREPTQQPKERFWALRDINLALEQGTTTGLIGRNGAGKTTLLKVMARITRPTSGRGIIRGRVGSLLEVGTGFHPELSGRENVLLSGAILGMSRAEVLSKFDKIVQFAGVEGFIDTPVKRYSSGMAMRLAFSVAAHLEPEVMLVDEVLAVGDNEFQKKCLNRIIEIAEEGRTVVFVSHNMSSVERVCDRAVLLDQGQMVANGPTQEVVKVYLGQVIPKESTEDEILSGELTTPKYFKWALSSDEALGPYTVVSGASCELTFRLAVPEPIDDAFFGIAVFTAENVLATAVSSYDVDGRTHLVEPGIHDVTFTLPTLPLGSGTYFPRVSLVKLNEGPVVAWNANPPFEVVKRRESNQIPPPLEGVLSIPGRVDVQPADTDQRIGSTTSGKGA